MTVLYRFIGQGVEFTTVGQLQKAEGFYVIVAAARYDDVLQLQLKASADNPIKIICELAGEAVAVMECMKIRAAEKSGGTVQIWAIVG